MTNPFFKNHGPFEIKNLLKLGDIDLKENYPDIKVLDIKDLVEANNTEVSPEAKSGSPSVVKVTSYSGYLLFRKGFMVGISNPKDLLFFIALFPSFMNADLPQMQQYIVLASTWFLIDCTSMYMYAGLGSKISPLLYKPRTIGLVNRTVGSVFIVLGSVLAASASISKKI